MSGAEESWVAARAALPGWSGAPSRVKVGLPSAGFALRRDWVAGAPTRPDAARRSATFCASQLTERHVDPLVRRSGDAILKAAEGVRWGSAHRRVVAHARAVAPTADRASGDGVAVALCPGLSRLRVFAVGITSTLTVPVPSSAPETMIGPLVSETAALAGMVPRHNTEVTAAAVNRFIVVPLARAEASLPARVEHSQRTGIARGERPQLEVHALCRSAPLTSVFS